LKFSWLTGLVELVNTVSDDVTGANVGCAVVAVAGLVLAS